MTNEIENANFASDIFHIYLTFNNLYIFSTYLYFFSKCQFTTSIAVWPECGSISYSKITSSRPFAADSIILWCRKSWWWKVRDFDWNYSWLRSSKFVIVIEMICDCHQSDFLLWSRWFADVALVICDHDKVICDCDRGDLWLWSRWFVIMIKVICDHDKICTIVIECFVIVI